jgi:hypothetical protein
MKLNDENALFQSDNTVLPCPAFLHVHEKYQYGSACSTNMTCT